jgi:alpha-amylase
MNQTETRAIPWRPLCSKCVPLLVLLSALFAAGCRHADSPPAQVDGRSGSVPQAPDSASGRGVAVATPAPPSAPATGPTEQFAGPKDAVMLQGFRWTASSVQSPSWYEIVRQNASVIKEAGFDYVWFPPPAQSVAQQGYIPARWYELGSRYGTAAELRAAISALAPARALADVVLNHRAGAHTGGADFEAPPFEPNPAAVASGDECHCGTGAADTGESVPYGRDLDHTNASVRAEVKKWLLWLKSDVGFAGWRYDMVKGYGGRYVADYNEASRPSLSVGEYWDDDRQKVVDWIDATGGRSMAFDFPTRTLLKRAFLEHNFGLLKAPDGKPAGVMGWWPRMSVTFLENHDTEPDNHNQPFPGDKVLAGYAYILTHPGVPCVFWNHFFDWGAEHKQKVRALIRLRREQHITSTSVVNIVAADGAKYAAVVDEKVAVKIGPGSWSPGHGWKVRVDGSDFAVWVRL